MAKKNKSSKPVQSSRRGQAKKKEAVPRKIPWFNLGVVALIVGVMAVLTFYRMLGIQSLPSEISVERSFQKYTQGAFILDVREQHEWDEYHIPGATLIPLAELAARTNELPQDQEIVVVCRSGNRSEEGRDILLAAGFNRVSSMAGGMLQWRAANHPIEVGE